MSLSVNIYKQLGDFTLDVAFETDGGVLGLLGASGCGKSYTLKCIAGIERPDRGRIVLDDTVFFDSEQHIDLPPQKRQVGYLFQNYALFPNMTVRQNILCGLHYEKDKAKREAALQQMLSFLQLEPLVNHRPAQLSGGQAQRVALA
ncbi:MAG: ATP-binding cassette domain-containing protein, partial [Clostridiales bacterium]|nr:ATP-binding cassette domain-containing protein [Clostridiales bacterium]